MIVICHGTKGSSDINWFPWLKRKLEDAGQAVIVPQFPTPENQNVSAWLEIMKKACPEPWTDMVLIGHSIGATFVLNVLEQMDAPAAQTIFVAPVMGAIDIPEYDDLNRSFYKSGFDWTKIRTNAGQSLILHGDDDPYVPLDHARLLHEKTGIPLTVITGGGHLNGESGFTEFPALLDYLKGTRPPL